MSLLNECYHHDVVGCARCGQDHIGILLFRPLDNPPPFASHYAACPKTNQPILLAFTEGEPRTCATCKWWEGKPDKYSEGRAVCLAACYPPQAKGLATVQHHFECLLTMPTFSCNQWEAKE